MLVYTEDPRACLALTRKLGEPEAEYFDCWDNGRFKGAHWRISKKDAKSIKRQFGKFPIEVE